ncbi:MAG TPA: alpha-ketoglutarate-dependent dioxygenase AlkB [Oligoflexus sp.]|uniref:alpha-ketoglutarate-dependent dioxygenase AlkB family protein n=1 Tax=Oligoflexus sp. TaxID=1971216 RepID=UPI002D45CB99|nr:alpha-ketoglutarate-dependent dioxygenase AlkB [Oligoflexus sp.]HYX32969.1 alpha-ketoglutarate-dependent dioxygenase AlkB [Oligoflexus sp.]
MKPDIILDDTSGRVWFWPEALMAYDVAELDQAISWRQDTITMFGRTTPLPRLTAWYGDPTAVYHYSGIRNEPLPWIPLLNQLRQDAETLTGAPYNSVLANRYADGSQSMSWHADDERTLGQEPRIASISLGGTRRFVLKNRRDQRRLELPLAHGSLVLMGGRLQEEWVHALPRTRKPVALRINLTFRCIHPDPRYQGKV